MAEISKITLPSGNTYDIKDATAREMISGGVSFNIVWTSADYASSTEPTQEKLNDIPKDVVVYYDDGASSTLGNLTASLNTKGKFYLIYSKTQTGDIDAFDEYVTVGPDSALAWEKIGDTQIDLSNVVTGVTLAKVEDKVLGEDTTFALSSGSVTHGSLTGHVDEVLGSGTTFTVTQPTITVTPSTTNIKATASGTAVGADGTASAVTGYASPTTDTFVKSVTAETNKKLVVTSITPTDGTESVSKVTKTASKLVTDTIPNVTGNTSVTIPNVTSNIDRDLKFEMGTGNDSETLIISIYTSGTKDTSSNTYNGSDTTLGSALTATNTTLGTAKTFATGAVASNGAGSDIVTAVTISDKTVAKAAASAVTVATGATDAAGTGDAIVTGVTVGDSASAITALGTPSTATVLTGVKVTTQPTVALATGATAGTGVISVATGISNASASGAAVSASGDMVDAVVSMPTSTVGTGITVGTNDKVTALTNSTDVTVIKGNA